MLSVFPTLINHTHLLTSSHLLKIKIFPVMSQTSWCLNVIDSSFTYLIKTILSYASYLTCQFIICSLVNLLKIPVFHIVFCLKKKKNSFHVSSVNHTQTWFHLFRVTDTDLQGVAPLQSKICHLLLYLACNHHSYCTYAHYICIPHGGIKKILPEGNSQIMF